MTEPARGTTKSVPSTLGSEFRGTMSPGVFGYLNTIGVLIFHAARQRMRCNGNFNRSSPPAETSPVHRLSS
jgi:hypothetical protein